MKRNNNKNLNMKGKMLTVAAEDDELFSLTDSANSSSSSNEQLPEKNQTLVMDLHEIKRDKDELPDNPLPEVKTRKLLKKKRPKATQDRPDQSAGSLTSSSEGSVVPPGPEKQEEFFDAHESYYDFPDPENQISGSALTTLTVTSKQATVPAAAATATPDNSAKREIPAITDPSTTTAPATQDTATGPTPLTSANPVRSRTPSN